MKHVRCDISKVRCFDIHNVPELAIRHGARDVLCLADVEISGVIESSIFSI